VFLFQFIIINPTEQCRSW